MTLWQFFDSSCAYCGARLARHRKDAHIDHLVPAASGGANHISNRVLSCANCNEKEKLDQAWEPFLLAKCPDPAAFELRSARIKDWIESKTVGAGGETMIGAAEAAAARVIAVFDAEVEALRRLYRDQALGHPDRLASYS